MTNELDHALIRKAYEGVLKGIPYEGGPTLDRGTFGIYAMPTHVILVPAEYMRLIEILTDQEPDGDRS